MFQDFNLLRAAAHVARPLDPSPLNVPITQARSLATADLRLDRLKAIRRVFGVTVNDVALAIIAGSRNSQAGRRRPAFASSASRGVAPA